MNKKMIGAIMVAYVMIAMVVMATGNASASDVPTTVDYTLRGEIYIWNDDFTVGNGVSSGTGTSGDPYIIENWEIDGSVTGYGIIIEETDAYYTIRNCYVYEARDESHSAGILLSISNNATIENCTIEECDIGISIDASTNVIIDECELESNGVVETGGGDAVFTGIEIISSDNIIISSNEIINDYSESIRIWNSYDCIIESNIIFNGTEHGIDFSRSWDNIIRNNHISYCLNGLKAIGDSSGLMPVEFNTIYNNTIVNNVERGIYLYNTENNTFYFNSLIGNSENVMEYNSVLFNGAYYSNIWYDDLSSFKVGNYYDDYTGSDINGDGIGEESYPITDETSDQVNFDYYPLVEAYNGSLPQPEPTDIDLLGSILISIIPVIIILMIIKWVVNEIQKAIKIDNKKR
ncbi:right-handed parallel beta-helix repeat-containing protein [candidate division WOR-3 bacterium]|nr:right-handed parallel beta-helix repeat-containing protein [candidate division WOR-3 bacterium]